MQEQTCDPAEKIVSLVPPSCLFASQFQHSNTDLWVINVFGLPKLLHITDVHSFFSFDVFFFFCTKAPGKQVSSGLAHEFKVSRAVGSTKIFIKSKLK